jgi:hypothetical protein
MNGVRSEDLALIPIVGLFAAAERLLAMGVDPFSWQKLLSATILTVLGIAALWFRSWIKDRRDAGRPLT